MPEHLSITLNDTVHHFNYTVSITKYLLPRLCNKYTTVLEEPDYPSNRPRYDVTTTSTLYGIMCNKSCSHFTDLFLDKL